jgi:hypothetical protein
VLTYIFTRTISLIEKVIDDESAVSHEEIGMQIGQFISDTKAINHFQTNNVISL